VSSVSKNSSKSLRVIVLGYIVRCPIGGLAWHYLQYFMGLANLQHDVYFVEDSDDVPWSCYDPTRNVTDTDPTYGLMFAKNTFARVGLNDRWAYFDAHKQQWHGPCADRIQDICNSADLVLNISGANPLRPWFLGIPARAYIDTDPVFTQIRNIADPNRRFQTSQHTVYFTFGENLTLSQSSNSIDQFPWQPTRQPVVLEAWPVSPPPSKGHFTTVMQWDSDPYVEYDGQRYGMKSESFLEYLDLAEKAGTILEIALGSSSAPRGLLRKKGWIIRNPLEVTRDPWTYQKYIRDSRAEFSVAKHGYVVTKCGWFSERSAAYLASGRPVVVQDTGFTNWMDAGAGVISFSTPEEALEGIEDINSRHGFHCHAARKIARDYFDSAGILRHLVERAMNP
jgi:hypothetical protein